MNINININLTRLIILKMLLRIKWIIFVTLMLTNGKSVIWDILLRLCPLNFKLDLNLTGYLIYLS